MDFNTLVGIATIIGVIVTIIGVFIGKKVVNKNVKQIHNWTWDIVWRDKITK